MAHLPPQPPGPRRAEALAPQSAGLPVLAVMLVIVAALYFGREIFVPMALAVLLSFALSPMVSWLRRRRLPRTPSVVIVVLVAFGAIFAFGTVVAGQLAQLAGNLPSYQANIQTKIQDLRGNALGGGLFERASTMLRDLNAEIARDEPGPRLPDAGDSSVAEADPIPVEIRQPDPEPLQLLQDVIGPLLEPLATGGIVIVFVIFMLLQREDLRDRFIRLAGTSDLHRTTQAISDAGRRVAHYLLMQLVVNVTYGIPVGVGLWLIGVPNPVLWGILAVVFRFVPYIGPVIAAMLPLALAVAVDPGWTMLFWTGTLFVVLELISNNIVEPWLYGSSTGLSPVAIIVGAIFWTWLWGPVGLLLSTPLTVCLVVLGRHVPQFAFLDVLLGSEPVLTPQEGLYQRLLAGDPDEAAERAEEFLEDEPLEAYYETVALPALAMMEQDRARGALDDSRRAVVAAGFASLIDNLDDYVEDPAAIEDDGDTAAAEEGRVRPPPLPDEWRQGAVVSIGARGNLDDAAAAMFGQVLRRQGIDARVLTNDAFSPENLQLIDLAACRLVCLSYLNADSVAHARYLTRRVRRRLPGVQVMVAFWSLDPETAANRRVLESARADLLATSLAEAAGQVVGLARAHAAQSQRDPGAASRATPDDAPPQGLLAGLRPSA